MRIYEDSRTIDEWHITSMLKLEDDGKFYYDENWGCYVGNGGGGFDGRWWQSGNTIFFHTEHADGNTYLNLLPGRDTIAVEEGDIIKFSEGSTYRVRKESTQNLPQPPEGGTLITSPISIEMNAMVAQAPVADSAIGKGELRKLSPELAARIRQWIEEMDAGIIAHLGKNYNFLPLHTNSIYMWALNLESVVMCLDHESASGRPEPETSPVIVYAVLVHGARQHRELAELIPDCPEGVRQCDKCGGIGWENSSEGWSESCSKCEGFGWYKSGCSAYQSY